MELCEEEEDKTSILSVIAELAVQKMGLGEADGTLLHLRMTMRLQLAKRERSMPNGGMIYILLESAPSPDLHSCNYITSPNNYFPSEQIVRRHATRGTSPLVDCR